jgi:predicted phosphodiesterase
MMKIISFSDLHLEFGKPFNVPDESSADVMILAGDIITFADFSPLEEIAQS